WLHRTESISDPLQFSESHIPAEEGNPFNFTNVLGVVIILISVFGLIVALGGNISEMVSLWIEDTTTFYFTIPVQYYLVLSCLVMTYVFERRLIASPFGRMITAVAQNEERAEALGYNSYRAKIVVMIISGAIAGLAGALYAPYIRTIDPDTALGVNVTIDAMLFTIIGGIGTLFGPLLGTGVVSYSELNLVDFITDVLNLNGRFWLVGLGAMYIIIVLFLPLGIVGSLGRRFDSLKGKLQRLQIGEIEFGLKNADYWVFGLLGAMSIFLLLTEDNRFLPIISGIFVYLGVIGLSLLYIFRGGVVLSLKEYYGRGKSRLKRIASRSSEGSD
ncbi:MAG: branched-chain amino acid ABC transporter permease, partial [Promethearchaeota archaeon]